MSKIGSHQTKEGYVMIAIVGDEIEYPQLHTVHQTAESVYADIRAMYLDPDVWDLSRVPEPSL